MIKTGKVADINRDYKDWFIGSFVKSEDFNTSRAKEFEVKWSNKEKGFIAPLKDKIVENSTSRSMAVLLRGKFKYSFLAAEGGFEEYIMSNEGDFIFWTPDINHKIEALEDSVVMTIRWYHESKSGI